MAKPQSIRSQLATAAFGHFDSIGVKKNGNIVVRRGYFYRNGMSSAKFADTITRLIAANNIPLEVADRGDQWRAFNGGASIANSSHFWVELTAV